MQVSPFMNDLIEFKDEMFKKIRLLEAKIMTEINNKNTKIYENYEKLENKLNYLNQNYDSLLETVTNQKLNLDKISVIENFKNKAEQNISMYNLKIKYISSEMDNMKIKYDRQIFDNLQVPGLIGVGCQFKTLSEYISNNVVELTKIRAGKDQLKIEIGEIKTKLDNLLKSSVNLVDTSIATCQRYADNKHKEMINILDNKVTEMNENNKEIRTQIDKNEINIEKKIEDMKYDIELLMKMKNEYINSNQKNRRIIS